LRRFGEQALESGILTIADLRTGSARACTLLQHTETAPPLLEAAPSDFVPPGASMRFSVEVERTTVGWLVRLGLIQPAQADDLGAILVGLRNVGLAPRIVSSP